jgi:hypothetical protein
MDEEIYCLDTSNPAVMDYLRKVFREFKRMGISFYKTDFMLYGAENSNDVIRFTPGKTSLQYQSEFHDMIRQEISQESFWLGCIAPFQSMIGYVDAMRISSDVHPKWSAFANMFEETKGGQHINNVWWQNDPDAMIVREQFNEMNEAETRTVALWEGMLGGVINTSDLFYDMPERRAELFRFFEPGKEKFDTRFPFLNSNEKLEVMARKFSNNAWAVLFTNRQDGNVTSNFAMKDLVGLQSANCFNWDESKTEKLGEKSNLTIDLKPHESRLMYISTDGKSPEGLTLGLKKK